MYLSLDERDGSDGLLQGLDLSWGAGDEGGARVHNGLTSILTQGQLAANAHSGFINKDKNQTQVSYRHHLIERDLGNSNGLFQGPLCEIYCVGPTNKNNLLEQ